MFNKKLDKEIQNALNTHVNELHIDTNVKNKIDAVLFNQNTNQNITNLEEFKMKKFNLKKVILIGAACMALSATALIAGGQIVGYSSSSSPLNAVKEFSKLEKLEQKLGYDVHVVEEVAYGYKFDSMQVVNVKGRDADGNVMETYPTLDVDYKNEAGDRLHLDIDQINVGAERRTPDQTLQVGDTTLYYNIDTYKFVPPNYELTEEDKANLEKPNYEISYGSQEVEMKMMSHVVWEKDGVNYGLLGIDTPLTADQMLQIASEMLQ